MSQGLLVYSKKCCQAGVGGRKKDQQVHKEECTEGDILKRHVLEGQFLKLRMHAHMHTHISV